MAAFERRDERSRRAYAGIGSRDTPTTVLLDIEGLAERFARQGLILRTGASPGADQAFYRGARAGGGEVELYLPCPGFQAHSWRHDERGRLTVLERPSEAACELAARFHPGWPGLDACERLLLARDGHEVLGAELDRPASFVVCWTADGTLDGSGRGADGTRQALRIAHHHGIPVFNLARPDHLRRMLDAQGGRCVPS